MKTKNIKNLEIEEFRFSEDESTLITNYDSLKIHIY